MKLYRSYSMEAYNQANTIEVTLEPYNQAD
jgi:hypothetical protein